jgi:hypothetical protein
LAETEHLAETTGTKETQRTLVSVADLAETAHLAETTGVKDTQNACFRCQLATNRVALFAIRLFIY